MKIKSINKIKKNWKTNVRQYVTYFGILLLGLLIGMTTTKFDALKQILINTISGIITNLPWFILIYIGIVVIGNSITNAGNKIVENVPIWLTKYEQIKRHHRQIERALTTIKK